MGALIPHIISVVYNPAGSDNERAATVRDVRDKQKLLAKATSRRRSSTVRANLRRKVKVANRARLATSRPRQHYEYPPAESGSADDERTDARTLTVGTPGVSTLAPAMGAVEIAAAASMQSSLDIESAAAEVVLEVDEGLESATAE